MSTDTIGRINWIKTDAADGRTGGSPGVPSKYWFKKYLSNGYFSSYVQTAAGPPVVNAFTGWTTTGTIDQTSLLAGKAKGTGVAFDENIVFQPNTVYTVELDGTGGDTTVTLNQTVTWADNGVGNNANSTNTENKFSAGTTTFTTGAVKPTNFKITLAAGAVVDSVILDGPKNDEQDYIQPHPLDYGAPRPKARHSGYTTEYFRT